MRTLLMLLCMLLIAGTAAARDLTFVDRDLGIPQATRYEGDCVVGNSDFSGLQGYYDGWWWGFEEYAYLVNAADEGCACPVGVRFMAVHMLLALDVDTNLLLQAALLEAVDDGTGCMVPGAVLAEGLTYTISGIPELNYYDIELPLESPCATVGDDYFIVFRFLDDGAAMVGLPIDSTPTACTAYNDWGSGWTDLVVAGEFAGNIYMWADLDCCTTPVAAEPSTWGAVKGLYR